MAKPKISMKNLEQNLKHQWQKQLNQENAVVDDIEKRAFYAFGEQRVKLLEAAKFHRENTEAYKILLNK